MRNPLPALGLALAATLASGTGSPAQEVMNRFVRIAPRVPGVVYAPVTQAGAGVAVVVMHDNNDFLDHPATVNLASRGYTVLAANNRFTPDVEDRDTDWDDALRDLGAAMRFARRLPGIERVVLLGHSSGAPLAAAYQNIAENGVKACQGPEKITPCPASLAGFERADALVLLDPIFGLGANVLASVDPAEGAGEAGAALDMYAPANGFSPGGAQYSEAFRRRFLAAQAARNARLIETALERRRVLDAGRGDYADDEPFVVPGATRTPRLWRPDLALLSHTRGAHLLLRGDGSRSTEVVRTVRVPSGLSTSVADRRDRDAAQPGAAASSRAARPLLNGGTLNTTVRRFLSTFASRSTADYGIGESAVSGIDWHSSYTSTPGSLEGVSVPLLVMGMTGHYWIVSAETAWEHAASRDKSVAFVEGATHSFTPCEPCTRTPGQFGDTVAATFDHVAGWIGERFGARGRVGGSP